MGQWLERPKRVLLWKKAVFHFALCFIIGFFTSFAPIRKQSSYPPPIAIPIVLSQTSSLRQSTLQGKLHVVSERSQDESARDETENNSYSTEDELEGVQSLPRQRRLLIVVTPMSTKDKYVQKVLLNRLAQTLKLVPPPLLWIVVEGQSDAGEVSELLRRTGIMYRHLVANKNFTNSEEELDSQRNLGLMHIELHKLSGIVHFADPSNVYDLDFFDYLRQIMDFGAWPIALVSPSTDRAMIEGPICESSLVIGWHPTRTRTETATAAGFFSNFAFNSSVLWDPERWGRSSQVQRSSQDSVKFVKQVALDDDTKVMGLPHDDGCSKILLWRLEANLY